MNVVRMIIYDMIIIMIKNHISISCYSVVVSCVNGSIPECHQQTPSFDVRYQKYLVILPTGDLYPILVSGILVLHTGVLVPFTYVFCMCIFVGRSSYLPSAP